VIPETHYAKTADGVHVAYQVAGEGPVDLVFVMGWATNIEAMWDEPNFARLLRRLAGFSRLILFDKRGLGLSDRVPDDRLPSLETRMDDVRAVMDAAASERAVVFGVSEGGPMSMLFAATYPARTIALALYGTAADFTAPGLNSQPLRLSDFKGRVVFLNFWATWCLPCKEEMPSMERLYRRYKERGLTVLAIEHSLGILGELADRVVGLRLQVVHLAQGFLEVFAEGASLRLRRSPGANRGRGARRMRNRGDLFHGSALPGG